MSNRENSDASARVLDAHPPTPSATPMASFFRKYASSPTSLLCSRVLTMRPSLRIADCNPLPCRYASDDGSGCGVSWSSSTLPSFAVPPWTLDVVDAFVPKKKSAIGAKSPLLWCAGFVLLAPSRRGRGFGMPYAPVWKTYVLVCVPKCSRLYICWFDPARDA